MVLNKPVYWVFDIYMFSNKKAKCGGVFVGYIMTWCDKIEIWRLRTSELTPWCAIWSELIMTNWTRSLFVLITTYMVHLCFIYNVFVTFYIYKLGFLEFGMIFASFTGITICMFVIHPAMTGLSMNILTTMASSSMNPYVYQVEIDAIYPAKIVYSIDKTVGCILYFCGIQEYNTVLEVTIGRIKQKLQRNIENEKVRRTQRMLIQSLIILFSINL